MADNVKVVEIDPVRDKLLELIRCADFHPCKGAVATIGSKFSAEFIEDIADHLIANGVTVTDNNVGCKWIPVTERLPNEHGRYLCNVKSQVFLGSFYQAILWCDQFGFKQDGIYTDYVTHWMPLPTPPKGE